MSFPRYPKYKASGVDWLGDVPEHWDVVPLKRIATIRYGIGEPPNYHDEGTPLIRATNVHAGRLFADGMVFVDPSEIPEQRIVWLVAGDIIVVRSGAYTGDSAIIPDGFGPCIAGFDMVLKCHSARPQFVQFALLSNYLKEGQIDLEKMRAAQPHLNAEELGSCVLVLPDADSQTFIAEFLDRETAKIDELVAEQQRLIELLKEKRQAVISHAVTKGLNPRVPMKPSGVEWLGEVPEHWALPPVYTRYQAVLGKMLDEKRITGTYPIPYLRNADVQWDRINTEDLPVFDITPNEFDRFTLQTGDILVCEGGAGIGQTAIWRGELNGCAFQKALHRLRPLSSRECPRFFYYCMRFVVDSGVVLAGGTATIPHLTGEKLRAFRFPCPPIKEQVAVAEFLDQETCKLDTLTVEAQRAIDLLQERRTALISAAVTGKIDVRGLVQSEAA